MGYLLKRKKIQFSLANSNERYNLLIHDDSTYIQIIMNLLYDKLKAYEIEIGQTYHYDNYTSGEYYGASPVYLKLYDIYQVINDESSIDIIKKMYTSFQNSKITYGDPLFIFEVLLVSYLVFPYNDVHTKFSNISIGNLTNYLNTSIIVNTLIRENLLIKNESNDLYLKSIIDNSIILLFYLYLSYDLYYIMTCVYDSHIDENNILDLEKYQNEINNDISSAIFGQIAYINKTARNFFNLYGFSTISDEDFYNLLFNCMLTALDYFIDDYYNGMVLVDFDNEVDIQIIGSIDSSLDESLFYTRKKILDVLDINEEEEDFYNEL